jgi:hypothetical protein
MDLKKGAVSKRWSRLKKAMENGEAPGGSVYKFLWLCLRHSDRDKVSTHCQRPLHTGIFSAHVLIIAQAMDWKVIADQCGTTAGAASKRYSRMKQAFESGADAPSSNAGSPAPTTPSKATPGKKTAAADGQATPTPKRKRGSPKEKAVGEEEPQDDDEEIKIKPEHDDTEQSEDEDVKKTPKKKAKATPKPKANGKAAAPMTQFIMLPPPDVDRDGDEEDDVMDSVEDEDGAPGSRE